MSENRPSAIRTENGWMGLSYLILGEFRDCPANSLSCLLREIQKFKHFRHADIPRAIKMMTGILCQGTAKEALIK